MKEIRNLKQLTKANYIDYSNSFGNLDKLGYLQNMIYEFEVANEEDTYILDVISDIADGYVSIYDKQVWQDVAQIHNWVIELPDTSLMSTLRNTIFRYNDIGLHENLDALIYNHALVYLDEFYELQSKDTQAKMLKLTEADIKDAIEDIDAGNYLGTIVDLVEELVANL